jgi:acetyltransferase-like isoleucine patch superfamily enzyme
VERWKNWKAPKLLENRPNKYNWIIQHKKNFILGYKTDIGQFSYINAANMVTIEDYVQIGSHCSIYSVSTIDDTKGPVVLKRNCRIGTHSVIMPGVTIGENSTVGAFSFVTRDIPENVVAFGVPAKIMRKMTKGEIEKIKKYCAEGENDE